MKQINKTLYCLVKTFISSLVQDDLFVYTKNLLHLIFALAGTVLLAT
jgi:hypothetical protein